MILKLDGNLIGAVENRTELEVGGVDFVLPDKSRVTILLAGSGFSKELQVTRNGQPVPGSSSAPQTRLAVSYVTVFGVGVLNIAFGIAAIYFNISFLLQLGMGIFSIGFGLVFIVLGFFVKMRSMPALILAAVIFGIDGALSYSTATSAGYNPNIGGLVARFLL